MNINQHPAPHCRHRARRSLVTIVLAASVAVGVAACGDGNDDPVSQRVPSAADAAQRAEALARDSLARRVAAAAGSDRHLELRAAEIDARQQAAAGSDRHLELQADEIEARQHSRSGPGAMFRDLDGTTGDSR